MKYENLDLPIFPSKYQVVGKIEKRQASFHLLLNKILAIAIENTSNKRNLIKTLYAFLTKNSTKFFF